MGDKNANINLLITRYYNFFHNMKILSVFEDPWDQQKET